MPLQLLEQTAVLTGNVSVEDAESLTEWLRQAQDPAVDLGDCVHIHTAAFQALLSARPRIAVVPADEFLSAWLVPLLVS